jgi:hypothetical protein
VPEPEHGLQEGGGPATSEHAVHAVPSEETREAKGQVPPAAEEGLLRPIERVGGGLVEFAAVVASQVAQLTVVTAPRLVRVCVAHTGKAAAVAAAAAE